MFKDAKSPSSPNINAVSIQLPSPWPENMAAWFHSVEAQFHCRGVGEELTKYFHVLCTLPEPMMQKLGKLLASPLSSTPYSDLKAELLKLATPTDIFRDIKLGDSKPSDFLSRLESLIPNRSSDDSYLRKLWLEKLPSEVQSILAVVPSTSTMAELAAIADKVVEAHFLQTAVAHVSALPTAVPSNTCNALATELQALRLEVRQLREEVRGIKSRAHNRARSVSSSRLRPRRRYVEASKGICFYHTNFGAHAKKCKQPCSWVGNRPARE